MKLIIDSNIIMAALISDAKTREIILKSGFTFYHPKIALESLEEYKNELIEKAGIDGEEYEITKKILFEKIIVVDEKKYLENIEEAENIMRSIDLDDSPFISLALTMDNDGIWSEDAHFKRQNRIKVWTTKELIDFIRENEELVEEDEEIIDEN